MQGLVPCGPDPKVHLDAIAAFRDAGYDELSILAVGPDQEGFFRFWRDELRPALEDLSHAG